MANRSSFAVFGLLILLLGAAPGPDPEELVRQGNAAFAREEYEAAVAAYTQAEERITDPGLVAFNKGAALFRLERYAEAAAHYRRCLEDARGGAAARMSYNLATCLLHESRGSNTDKLKEAVLIFRRCLRSEDLEDGLRDSARHNLELAKLLWLKASQTRQSPDNGDNPNDPPPKPDPKTPEDPAVGPGESGQNPSGEPATGQTTPDPGPNPMTDTTSAGSGNLPPVPDNEELTRMLPEDAAAHLQRAAERVLRERREHQRRMAPSASRVLPDW